MFNLHLHHQFFLPKFPRSSSSLHRRSHDPVTLRRREFHRSIFSPPLSAVVRSGTDGGGRDLYEYGWEDDELTKLLSLLPETMQAKLLSHDSLHDLVEIVLDLGRVPLARFPSGDFVLSPNPISSLDLHHATSQIGMFAADNRAGISRTLHRISAIRNRNGVIVGLTCRVGRAVTGSADSLRSLVKDGNSLLLIGPPGVGKTTIIREIARMLADDYKKRVMIVDTSNEIGGDGDIPHPGIGNARRMQVPKFDIQHKVLIEAVENHMPQAIIIDEIGTKLEAIAASTIAQRGIQLVATAHGVTIENLIMNPSLDLLVGGIQSVTLGDEEASRRHGKKTIQERKGPSTFTCGVEIISKSELRVHQSLESTVDSLLSGRRPIVKICKINSHGFTSKMEKMETVKDTDDETTFHLQQAELTEKEEIAGPGNGKSYASDHTENSTQNPYGVHAFVRIYVYGISETSMMRAIKKMKIDDIIQISQDMGDSDGFLALHSKLKKTPQIHAMAKSHNLPIYVTKTSSVDQISKAIRALVTKKTEEKDPVVEDDWNSSEKVDALEEARLAIEQIVIPKEEPVELLPRPPHLLSAQIDLIREYNLKAVKVGKEPRVFIRIIPVPIPMHESSSSSIKIHNTHSEPVSETSLNGIDRLPLLPE